MMKLTKMRARFVEFIPDQLDDGVLYISERFRTCSHKCCCGCGEEVVTPLSPAEWSIRSEGDTISLWPSVGNWSYACMSHYIIRRNRVLWAPPLTERQIARVRQRDAAALKQLVAFANASKDEANATEPVLAIPRPLTTRTDNTKLGSIRKLVRRLFGSPGRSPTS